MVTSEISPTCVERLANDRIASAQWLIRPSMHINGLR